MTDKHRVSCVEGNQANMRFPEENFVQFPEVELIGVDSAERGLDAAVENRPELILMDIHLPGMDGYQALSELKSKQETRHIPVVAISANAMDTDVQRGLSAGFDGYLTKPLILQEFMSMIRAQLKLG